MRLNLRGERKVEIPNNQATELRLEKEQKMIEMRLQRRIRQTKTFNKHELMKDVKLVRKTNHDELMKQLKLKKDNEVTFLLTTVFLWECKSSSCFLQHTRMGISLQSGARHGG
jgi:hypothetical protein